MELRSFRNIKRRLELSGKMSEPRWFSCLFGAVLDVPKCSEASG